MSIVDIRVLGDSLKGLRIYKGNQADRSRKYILSALIELNKHCTPNEIQSKIKEIISTEVENEFERGMFVERDVGTQQTKTHLVNSRLISIKTIRRHLNGPLLKEGLVKLENKLYSITDKILSQHEIISLAFGNIILLRLCQNFTKQDVQENFEKYFVKVIEEIGIFVIYIFLRFLEPYEDPSEEKAKLSIHGRDSKKILPLTTEDKRRYRQLWTSNAIPASLMLHFLESILGLVNFSNRRPSHLTLTDNEYADYEMNRTTYKKLISIIRKHFPGTYDTLRHGERDFVKWCLSLSSQQSK